MSFEIPRAVLALAGRLIDRLRLDPRTSRTSPLVVRVDIIHVHEETGIRDIGSQRGIESMLRRHAMQSDRGVTRTDLAVNGLTFRVSMHAPALEPEGTDEETAGMSWYVSTGMTRAKLGMIFSFAGLSA